MEHKNYNNVTVHEIESKKEGKFIINGVPVSEKLNIPTEKSSCFGMESIS